MSSVYSQTHVSRARETETIKTSSPSICRLDSLFNTIGKKKKYIKEVEDLEEEGKHAIDGPMCKPVVEQLPTNEFLIEESEERRTLETSELQNRQFQSLLDLLKNWINDELSSQRIIVKNLEDDLYDGQILGKLVEKLSGQQLDVVEITQNEDLQKYKLRVVLETSNRLLGLATRYSNPPWSVEGIHNKNLVELTHLLVALIRHYRAPIRLPENVFVNVNVVQRRGGQVISRTVSEQLTGVYDELAMRIEPRDAIDSLFTSAPDRLQMVKKSLINFVNRHLNRINIECYTGSTGNDLDPNQFSDGLLLCFLMGMLEGYFVPLGNLFTTSTEPELDLQTPKRKKETALQPENYINTSPLHKLHNVNVAFQLMEDAGIEVQQRVRAEDIVNSDLKSLIRVLYMIFTKYKHL